MNRRSAALLLASVFLLAVVAILTTRSPSKTQSTDGADETAPVVAGETAAVELYFPDAAGGLTSELRQVEVGRDPEAQLGHVLEALLAGPTGASLFPPLDPAPGVGSIYLNDAGTAYINLVSSELASPPVHGTRDELLTIYSFVNTLLGSTPEVESIVFLWNGHQLESFAGHIDTTRPLVANPNL